MFDQMSVSNSSVINMGISAALSILVPVAVIIFMAVKKRLDWKAALIGTFMFIMFAMVLENIMHTVVFNIAAAKSALNKNTLLYVLYGGLAAGIFEETARLLGFRFLIKFRHEERLNTGISYGLGHGGIEAILLGGFSALGNLMTSVMLNSGSIESMTATIPGEQLDALKKSVSILAETPSHMFLVSGFERLIALLLQVALSLFVIKAVTEKRWQYFIYAVLIHTGVDMIALLYQKGEITDIFLTEGIVLLVTVIAAAVAFRIIKRNTAPEQIGAE